MTIALSSRFSLHDMPNEFPDISPPQQRVLKFFIEYRRQHNPPQSPNYDEICAGLGVRRGNVNEILCILRDKRLMTENNSKRRGWRPTPFGELMYDEHDGAHWQC